MRDASVTRVQTCALPTFLDALSGEADADAALGSITISKVPAGVTLSAGTSVLQSDGTPTWTPTPAQLRRLTLTGHGETTHPLNLHVGASTHGGGNISPAGPALARHVNTA